MKELKAPDKVVQKMTRDGAVAENLATGETESISGRDPETDLSGGKEPVATAEAAAGHIAQTEARRSAKKQAKAEEETIREGSEVRQRPPYRLQFTDEERADPAFQKYIRHSDKAANKLDAAKEAIPTRKVLKTERVFDEAAKRQAAAEPSFPSCSGDRPCCTQRGPQGGAGKCGCGGGP